MNNEERELTKLVDICHYNIRNSKECALYLLKDRGLRKDIVKKYKLGYFPQNISVLTKHVSIGILEKASIVRYSGDSLFSEFFYLTFPILSEYSKVVGIAGRTLLSESQRNAFSLQKYNNSSYKKAKVLYGLNFSRSSILKNKNVYITEGFFDHISLDQAGIFNSVAICGTAFSKLHFLTLAKYTKKMTFILDRDDAGRESMNRISKRFSNKGIILNFKTLPEGYKDVDEYFSSGKSKDDFYRELETFITGW